MSRIDLDREKLERVQRQIADYELVSNFIRSMSCLNLMKIDGFTMTSIWCFISRKYIKRGE